MKPTLVVCGYGPGISGAVARKFGQHGFAVALVARTAARVEAASAALAQQGVPAKGFAVDLGDSNAVHALMSEVRSALGPIAVLHWNAYAGGAGDLTTANLGELRTALDVSVHGLIAAVQAALPDLRSAKGSVLVTSGGLALYDPKIDAMAVQWGAMGLAVAKAAQHKAVGLLSHKLAKQDVYVGEVVVMGAVKGTAFDSGRATIEASAVADKFWELHEGRAPTSVHIA